VMMGMQDWYVWESPGHLKAAVAAQAGMEEAIRQEIFGTE